MNEVLHLEIRKKIYNLLLVNPGLNLSKIAQLLDISVSLADYHLYFMEDNGLIIIEKEAGYKRYYLKGKVSGEEKKILSLLHQDTPLNVVLFLLYQPFSKPKEIRDNLRISPALLTYYLRKLKKHGVVAEGVGDQNNTFYVVKEKKVVALLIQYKPNVLLQRFKDTWMKDFPLSSKISEDKK